MSLAPLMSRAATGGKDDWQTPDEVLELVRRVAPIGIDPCGAPGNPVRAKVCYWGGPDDIDGLGLDWGRLAREGLVYVNPPFSQAKKWAEKAIAEGVIGGTEIILLLPARTDTKVFEALRKSADAVCFWHGRMKFKGAPTSAPFPSALFYFGERAKVFERVFSPRGWVVRR